jgi:hypothetical protein
VLAIIIWQAHFEVVMRNSILTFCCLAIGLIGSSLHADDSIADSQLGFDAQIPSGFKRAKNFEKGNILRAYHRPPSADKEDGIFIFFERMQGVIGREPIDQAGLNNIARGATVRRTTWKEFEINVIRIPEKLDGGRLVTFNAQIPLSPEAFQLKVSGSETNEVEVYDILTRTLSSVDGRTNWLSSKQREERFRSSVASLVVYGGAFVAVAIWLVVRWIRRKRQRRLRS